jgi:hypothetical protein
MKKQKFNNGEKVIYDKDTIATVIEYVNSLITIRVTNGYVGNTYIEVKESELKKINGSKKATRI